MKKLMGIVVFIMILALSACGGTTTIPTVTTSSPTPSQEKITLTDSPIILDLLPLLPDSFEKVDAASEGLSNKDMGLGSDCSEVEFFLSEEPFQMIYGFFGIIESRVERASSDAMLRDEAQIKELLVENITAGIQEEDLDASYAQTSIAYPNIADLAVYGEGQIDSSGFTVGFDILWFKVDKVYVFLYSAYYGSDRVSLENIAKELIYRISMYTQ